MIREILASDAEEYLLLNKKLDNETKFMLYEEEERNTTVEDQAKIIDFFLKSPNSTILVAEKKNKLVGHIGVIGGKLKRVKYTASIAVGVLLEYSNQGIGTQLFQEMEIWAKNHGLKRLELTVMSHNNSAISLYKKMGFEIEGLRKCSLMVDGKFIDEYSMSKIL
ncbi:GNAT family N-acetyltransferase [Priestia megaterium]|uniref:GNAT family N-acetyltransferase n=1 Tax=Priestia megaterium TaxID=1404 RepID=UPI002A6B3D39|nr:GNAT family N-acetyltransferase [Priestia megaterium]MDY0944100.1 GNAT family N-acetyltransferase [Priestia megaterium]